MAPSTKMPAPPVTEKGYVNAFPGFWAGFGAPNQFDEVPDLLWPTSVRTYTQMYRSDTRIASLLKAIGLPVRRTRWWIDKNGASDEVTEFVARDLGLPIRGAEDQEPQGRRKDRFSWNKHLQTALKHLQFGHQFFEKTYSIDDAGRAHLYRLSPRPSPTLAFMNVAANGDLVAIEQWPPGTAMLGQNGAQVALIGGEPGNAPIPASRIVAYLNDPDPGTWFGNSLLRPAWGNWVLKQQLLKIGAASAERHGLGIPKINVSEEESQDPVRMGQYGCVASQMRAGMNSGIAFPFGTDGEIMGVTGNIPSNFIQQQVEYHDKAMAFAALMHFLNLDKGGSYALASVLTDPWVQAVQTVADDIIETTQSGVIEDMVTVNWGLDEPVPVIGCDEIGSRQDATAAALQLLRQADIITPDDRLEAYEREQLGLPSADPETARDEPDTGEDAPDLTPDPTISARTSRVPVRAHTRSRSPHNRPTFEPNGALTLW